MNQMIEALSQIQARVRGMREALVKDGSVMHKKCLVTRIEAKKQVIWYLDCFAAAIAGAHWHMFNMEMEDDIFSRIEKKVCNGRLSTGWIRTWGGSLLQSNITSIA